MLYFFPSYVIVCWSLYRPHEQKVLDDFSTRARKALSIKDKKKTFSLKKIDIKEYEIDNDNELLCEITDSGASSQRLVDESFKR